MEIKGIKKLRNGKYQIIFINGDKVITYDEVLLKDNLLYKKELSTKEIRDIESKNNYYDVYNSSVKHLSKKMHSIKEMREYLNKYELPLIDKNKIIDKLKEIGLLNDLSYVKAYIYDKFYLSNDGPYKIKRDLISNGIKEDVIDNEIKKLDNEEILEKVKKLVSKKVKVSKGSSYITRQKITRELELLGYPKSMIEECYVDNRDESSFLEKDFEKIYNHLVRKESDKDKLSLKVKQKMYAKGYNLSEVEKLLEKKER